MYVFNNQNIMHEIACGSNFGYVLSEDVHFISTDYKVLQSQVKDIFVRCLKMLYNGNVFLYYITDAYQPFSVLLTKITPDHFIQISLNIFNDLTKVQNNGFLSSRKIMTSWEKIFIDPVTYKAKLVYLPVDIMLSDDDVQPENDLRKHLARLAHQYFLMKNERLERFLSDLSDGRVSVRQLCENYASVHTDLSEQPFCIRAVNAPEPFEILLDKEIRLHQEPGFGKGQILLGSRREFSDIEIPFNKRISRKHCCVVHNSGGYFIADEGSRNGTFVNNKRLVPHQYEKLQKGMVLRLADSVFEVL